MIGRSNIFMTKSSRKMCRTGPSRDSRQQVIVDGLATATGFIFLFLLIYFFSQFDKPFEESHFVVHMNHVPYHFDLGLLSVTKSNPLCHTKNMKKSTKNYEGTFMKLHKNISRCLIY